MSEISRPPQLLIVDDDQGLLRLMSKALKREGFETATALSGGQAIEWLSGHDADLMLLDLKLPDLGGMELITRLTAMGRSVPFIVITGQGDERVAVEMMKGGASDYLVKDVKLMDFLPAVVRRSLDRLEKDQRLAAAQAALEESKAQLVDISERERRRFGAELHDGLGQQLTAIRMLCERLRRSLPPAHPDLETQLSEIDHYLEEAVQHTRALAHGLAPLGLGSGGFLEALSELALRTSKAGRVQCRFDPPEKIAIQDEIVAGHLFRIAQEAVHNAVKHSHGTEVEIRLTEDPDGTVCLRVQDNGQGLRGSATPAGIGLQVMQHRASVIGAQLTLDSVPEKGVHLSCTLPAAGTVKSTSPATVAQEREAPPATNFAEGI